MKLEIGKRYVRRDGLVSGPKIGTVPFDSRIAEVSGRESIIQGLAKGRMAKQPGACQQTKADGQP